MLLLLKFNHGFYKNVQLKLIFSLLQLISLASQFAFIFRSDSYNLLFLSWPTQQDLIISQRIVSVLQLRDQLEFFVFSKLLAFLFLWLISPPPQKLFLLLKHQFQPIYQQLFLIALLNVEFLFPSPL